MNTVEVDIVWQEPAVDILVSLDEAQVLDLTRSVDVVQSLVTGPVSGSPAAAFVREEPLGVIDGANDVFSTASLFVAGSTVLYLNGLAQSVPDDYSELSADEIQMVEPPLADDRLLITYMEA